MTSTIERAYVTYASLNSDGKMCVHAMAHIVECDEAGNVVSQRDEEIEMPATIVQAEKS